MLPVAEQMEIIRRGAVEILVESELEEKLNKLCETEKQTLDFYLRAGCWN